MDLAKLELLLKKVETASKIIDEMKSTQEAYKAKIEELSGQLDAALKQNAELKDENSSLQENIHKNELMHASLEEKIIQILDKLPDLEVPSEELTVAPSLPVADFGAIEVDVVADELSDEEISAGEPVEEKTESLFTKEEAVPAGEGEAVAEEGEEYTLPYFESEDREYDYENMFAFDDIATEEQDTVEEEELPKGVL